MKSKIFYILFILVLAVAPVQGQVFEFPPSLPLELHKPLDEEARRLQRAASQYENRGENEKALNLYLQLYQEYPEYTPFYDGVIRGFITTERYDEGLAFVDSIKQVMLKAARPQDLTFNEREMLANLIVDGGRFSGRLGQREEAFRRWNELYSLPNPTANPYFRLFSALIDCRYPDGLEDMAERARQATGNPSLLAATLASYWADRGQVNKAMQEWLMLMEIQPRQTPNIQAQILNLPEDQQTRQQVEEALKAARSRRTIRIQVMEMLASLYFRNRQWEEAYEQVLQVDKESGGGGEALLSFAETLNSENEFQLALRVLADLSQTHPDLSNTPRGLLALARALEAAKEYSRADSVYEIITSDSRFRSAQEQEALINQARLRLERLRRPEAARNLLEEGLKRNPRLQNRGEAALLIGDSYLAQRKLERARDTYLDVAQGKYGAEQDIRSRALVNAAQMDIYLGDTKKAVERLDEASKQNPNGLLTNDALDMLDMLRNDATDSVGLATLARADLEAKLGNNAEAESLYATTAEKSRVGDLAERSLLKLAELQRKTGLAAKAMETLEEALNRFPESLNAPEILLTIGETYEKDLEDPKLAVPVYERILVEYPQSLQVEEARRRIRKIESPET